VIKVVLDTNILVSALFWNGNPHILFERCCKRDMQSVTSIEILRELHEVLSDSGNFEITSEEIDNFIDVVMETSIVVKPDVKVDVIKDDPTDNKILECAVAGRAKHIVSGDGHLLDLGRCEGIKIMTASEFLKFLDEK